MKEYLLIGKKGNLWDVIKNYYNLDSKEIKDMILNNEDFERFVVLKVERISDTQIENVDIYKEFIIDENKELIEKNVDNELQNFIYNNIIFY